MLKICKICKVRLTKENSYQTTFNLLCKTHYRERVRNWKLQNPDKIKRYIQTYTSKDAINRASKRAYQKFPEKWNARAKLRYSVKKGLVEKLPCYCGEVKSQGHHFDYKQPLRATWLCAKHHSELHNTLDYLTSYYQGL